ncbi:MAG: NADP-dependent phosphogluconate dehydrogenase [Chitinophagaceae bacterium]|nr:NADP-dependent phosphogluconate dehydrogenase [Chitinophagaceae bacterium]
MTTTPDKYDIGMIGLGTMGRNLLLNIGDHGFAGAGYDKNPGQVKLLEEEATNSNTKAFSDLDQFIGSLKSPRYIMMLVPAGKIVDSVIEELVPLLDKGDILIDGGNSHFNDTNRRVEYLETKGLHFFGMGISGGEEGARKGPSMMPGGDQKAYQIMKPLLEAIAAKVNGDPCVTYIGKGAAGHFVKMVHNGIEYGLMQLIAETYELLRKGMNFSNDEIHAVFKKWNEGRLQSFLMETTRDVFAYKVPGTNNWLLDNIKDEAKSKGTGKWTSQVAMDLQSPTPTIDTAVAMRDLSKYKELRELAAGIYSQNETGLKMEKEAFLNDLEQAFYFSMIITYAQGMQLIAAASKEYGYGSQLAEIAQIWRGGCIIRSTFLNQIHNAYKKNNELKHLLLDEEVARLVKESLPATRNILSSAVSSGLAIPAYASSLSYFDALRSERMPSNLIQAQRDYFGAHTYELIGQEGVFHTQWVPEGAQ